MRCVLFPVRTLTIFIYLGILHMLLVRYCICNSGTLKPWSNDPTFHATCDATFHATFRATFDVMFDDVQ